MAVIHKPAGEQYLLTYASIKKFFPPITTVIVIVQIGLFIAGAVSTEIRDGLFALLAASPPTTIGSVFLWQLVTYILLSNSGLGLVLNGAALVTIASRLERLWGRGPYLLFVALMAVLTAVPFLALGAQIGGCFGLVVGSTAAFGWVFRRQHAFLFTYRIPVPVYIIAVLAILVLLNIPPIVGLLWFLAALWGLLFARVMEFRQTNRAYNPPKRPKDQGRFKGLDLGD